MNIKAESVWARPAGTPLFGRIVVASILLHAVVLFFVAPPTSAMKTGLGNPLVATLRLQSVQRNAAPAASAVAPKEVRPARARQQPVLAAVVTETPQAIAVPQVAPDNVPAPRAAEAVIAPSVADAALPVAAPVASGADARSGVGAVATALAMDSAATAEAEAVALARYRRAVLREVGRVKSYPEAARQAGYSGKVTVQHQLVAGRADPQVSISSSTPMLDQMGLDMVRLAAERVAVPEILAKSSHRFNVAILFNLTD